MHLSLWDLDEMDLLSRRGESKMEDDPYSTTETGQLYSIYNEPIIGFARKRYKVNQKEIVLVRINDDVFKYQMKDDSNLEVFINDSRLGLMSSNHKPSQLQLPKSVIDIDNQGSKSLLPVQIDGRHVLSINSDDSQPQSRVLTKIDSSTPSESKAMLALMIHGLVTDHI